VIFRTNLKLYNLEENNFGGFKIKGLNFDSIIITIVNIIHRPVFYLQKHFGDWILSPSSGGFEDRDYLCFLDPTKKGPHEDGDRIQSPKSCVLNKI
jgi:hypothetical protein